MLNRAVRRRITLSVLLALSWRPTGTNMVAALRSVLTSFIALGVAFVILPGQQSNGPASVLLLGVVAAATGVVLRPVLLGLTVLLGSFGLLVAGLLAQAAVLAVAESIAPDIELSSISTIIGASWIAVTVAAVVNWLLDSGSQDAYLSQTLGRVVRIAHRHSRDADAGVGEPGLLVVQLDGVGRDLLRQAMVAGAVPTLTRWVRSGTHRGYRWHTGLPATTPAGQAVLLHGDVRAVPSFRWYEKDTDRMMVANHPTDAARIQQRISTGRGLLAYGGVSVSNLFSGDAPTRVLTMSDARLPSRSTRGLASFATTSVGLVRTLVVFVGQVFEELYQARRQRRRDVRPRVARGGQFAMLRGVTTALLHDLNVAIVAEQLARGAPVVFVDFVDYDEIAHHAGPSRPEAIRTLDGLDRVLRFFEDVAREANRRYEIVVLSDHGQAQGTPFATLAGRPLEELVQELADSPVRAEQSPGGEPAERWGQANLLLTSAARSAGPTVGRYARWHAARTTTDPEGEPSVNLGRTATDEPGRPSTVKVAAAGSLAHVYFPAFPGRATREDVDAAHPGLVERLVATPGVGVVVSRDRASGLVAIGADGWRELTADGAIRGAGEDPLEQYGPGAARDLLDLDAREHVGDLVVLGRHDRETGEVAAFESLVGSHGGLGGDQTEAVLYVPSAWPAIAGHGRVRPCLTGRQVHDVLVARLHSLGLRPDDVASAADVPVPVTGSERR